MIKIAPSILSADFGKLGVQVIEAQRAGADMIHLDVIDGHFAPNISFGPAICKIAREAVPLPMDAHLMITDPENYIDEFIGLGVDYINFHLEIGGKAKELGPGRWVYVLDGRPKVARINRLIDYIREQGCRPGIALNPPTDVHHVFPYLDRIDILMFMSVNPGFSGQAFIDSVYDKIQAADHYRKQNKLNFEIMVDGGVDLSNARKLHDLGTDILVSGSSFFKSKDYAEFIKEIKST
jgi:ribulose-phosphate 3-epimerase